MVSVGVGLQWKHFGQGEVRMSDDNKKPYPVFQEPGVLSDDTVLTLLGAGMTVKEFDDILLRNFKKNLERGNEIIRQQNLVKPEILSTSGSEPLDGE